MKNKLVATCITAAVVGTASMSFGAGFKISEQGAKAMGMANAFVAQADDPSALAFNPAGIAFQKGTQMQVGTTTILVPQTKFTGTTRLSGATVVDEKANADIFIAPTVYATTSLEDMPLSFGLGINSFHPLAKRWDTSSAFRDSIQSISIKPVNFQPTVAYRFDDLKLAVAGGVDVTYAQVSLQKMAYVQIPNLPLVYGPLANTYQELGTVGADATATGYGYNLGLLWKPVNNLSVGAAYRSKIKLGLEGDANFLRTGANAAALGFTSQTVRTTGSTDITLPDALSLGVAWKPIDKLTVELDAERTGWSCYNQLELKFGPGMTAFNGKPDPKNWENVWAYRLGAQYAVTPKMDLRAGYAYDNSPAPDATVGPELPDADRHNFTAGTGLHNEFGSIDMSYMWVHWVDRNVANAKQTGTYQSDAHLFAVGVTYKF